MIPRHKLDISYSTLLGALFWPWHRKKTDISRFFPDSRYCFLSLSVRTCWDLILRAVNLPAGSEVLMSNINIADMVKIVRNHQLVPIPIGLDSATQEFDYDAIKNKINEKTKIILIAQLFGAKSNLEIFQRIKERHPEVLIIEDLAQSYADGHQEHPYVDISMYSFGTIKTLTALGGSVCLVREHDLYVRMNDLSKQYPQLSRSSFNKKIVKVFMLKIISTPLFYTLLHRFSELFKIDLDQLLSNAVKGFPGDKLIQKIRQRPPQALWALLERQLHLKHQSIILRQRENAQTLLKLLACPAAVSSYKHPNNFFWVFAYHTKTPHQLIKLLRANGLDASQRSSQMCTITDHGEYHLPLDEYVYLPINPSLSRKKLLLMAELINSFCCAKKES
jgi:perosamine synthetase